MHPDSPPPVVSLSASQPSRVLRWADRLAAAGLVLVPLTLAIEGLGLLTFFLIPCCFYLSWVGYVAAWPVPRGWRWLLVGSSALAANALVLGMASSGYLRSALVCGLELLVAWGWQRGHQATGRWFGPAALALWLAAAGLGLRQGSLFAAVQDNNPLWVSTLLRIGADANATVEGEPVLHEALSGQANPEVVGLLLRHGANPNAYWKRTDGSRIEPAAFAFAGAADPGTQSALLRRLLAASLNPCQLDQHGQNFRQSIQYAPRLAPADSAALARAEQRYGCR